MAEDWSFYTLFEQAVHKYPLRPALFIGDRFYSYLELFARVAVIHQQLAPLGSEEPRIGIYCSDNAWTYAAILAIAAHGAAYFPLNPAFPDLYNRMLVERSGIGTLLLPGLEADITFSADIKLLPLGQQDPPIPGAGLQLESRISQPEAYLLFTSGTTGEPKGVPVLKSNARALFDYFLDPARYDFSPEDRFLQVYDLTFDVSVFSFFLPLFLGACCYSVPHRGIRWTEILLMLRTHEITVVSLVPSVLQFWERYFGELRLPLLRYSFFSGDRLLQPLAKGWKSCLPKAVIHNFYGPTETTVVCTRYVWEQPEAELESLNGIVPLGEPFPGMRFILVDETGHQVQEAGLQGELCFVGIQTIPNYLNGEHPEKFLVVTEGPVKTRYYRTGDLASVNPRGQLLFRGRTDRQVKINGFRVELGAVEHHLNVVTGNFAVAIAVPDRAGHQVIIAFSKGAVPDEAGIRQALSLRLPAYMIPRTIVSLENMPLTSNGKLDWQTLDRMALKLQE